MAQLLVVGGRQRRGAVGLQEWQAYDQARVVIVDTDSGIAELYWTYETPQHLSAPSHPSQVFKSGFLEGDRLWLVTLTEVTVWDCHQRRVVSRWSHPWFNDLHHVRPLGADHWLVANTGLDQVLKLNSRGEVTEQWGVGQVPTWERFDPEVDYRQVPTTKPHETHPNFVFIVEEDVWVTRFHPQDAICLSTERPALSIQAGGPHDGVEFEAGIGFTTVNGFLGVCPRSVFSEPKDAQDPMKWTELHSCRPDSDLLGWCRGLHFSSDGEAWVGFSRLRPTKFRRHVSWLKHGFRSVGLHGTAPTRIARYDVRTGECLQEIDLEAVGLNAVFGIYEWDA
ncbi:MAG: hypothetical protein VXX31_16285 [Planctomycetota bacterium]|nr:hypothetical protein [Planctomycetota bacterium]